MGKKVTTMTKKKKKKKKWRRILSNETTFYHFQNAKTKQIQIANRSFHQSENQQQLSGQET